MSQPQRAAVINLYKTLLYLGRDWPQGYELFRKRLHKVFTKNSEETDPKKIEVMIKHGDFVVKEIEALYKLKKYRAMKRSHRTSTAEHRAPPGKRQVQRRMSTHKMNRQSSSNSLLWTSFKE